MAALLGLIPLQQALSPLPSPERAVTLARLWAQPAAVLGVLAGLAALGEGRTFLARLDARSRRWAEVTALLASGLLLHLPCLAGSLLGRAEPSGLARLAPAILTSLLHLAGVAHLLSHPALPVTPRLALFLALIWLLPALSGPASGPGLALLDALGPLRDPSSASLASSLAASACLLSAGRLVRT